MRQRPPAPRKVGSPDEADKPAPRRARIRFEERREEWKESISACGMFGRAEVAVEAILIK